MPGQLISGTDYDDHGSINVRAGGFDCRLQLYKDMNQGSGIIESREEVRYPCLTDRFL